MKSGLGRWLRGGAVSLRLLWTSGGGACVAGVAIAASLAWLVPAQNMHLLPDRSRAVASARPTLPELAPEIRPAAAPVDTVEGRAAATPAVRPPPALRAAYRSEPPADHANDAGSLAPVANAPVALPASPA